MKILKKNQLAILVIALMLITAGYLNYDMSYGEEGPAVDTSSELDGYKIAELGDAELVNANVTQNIVSENTNETNIENTVVQSSENNEVSQTTSAEVDDYFETSKLERNVMYSQMIERYQEIIDSSSQITEQKTIAQQEINKINELQNAIMIAENLLTTKGFTQSVIFVNRESVSVIIGKEELKQEEIAQVQNIVSRELNTSIENIHISLK